MPNDNAPADAAAELIERERVLEFAAYLTEALLDLNDVAGLPDAIVAGVLAGLGAATLRTCCNCETCLESVNTVAGYVADELSGPGDEEMIH